MVAWKHFLLASLAAAALTGCNRQAKSDGSGHSDHQSTDRRASIGSLKRALDDASDRLAAVQDRATKAGTKVRQEVRDEIADLEKARDRLYAKLGELQATGAEGWEEMKDEAAAGVDSLGRAVNRTWKNVTAEERSAQADVEGKDR